MDSIPPQRSFPSHSLGGQPVRAVAFANEESLERSLSEPEPETVELMNRIEGPLLILGAGGKMGPTLARMARRAADAADRPDLRVVAVSRFSSARARRALEQWGIEVHPADLSDPGAVEALPDASDVLYLAGRKFGEKGSEATTWVLNTFVPGLVGRRFAGARVVAFSTGCVYPLRAPGEGNCSEEDPSNPVGEYASSCLGRERLFEYSSRQWGLRVLLYRLNYAIDLRYGVLIDIAEQIRTGGPVQTGVPEVNIIWQGDANNYALRALELAESPPATLNVTGVETLSVPELARGLAERLGVEVEIRPPAAASGYVSNAGKCARLLGPPKTSVENMLDWTAEWVAAGGGTLGNPTRFEVTNGVFLK